MLRYLILIAVVVGGLSVLRGVDGAFKGGIKTDLPGLETPPEFMKGVMGGAVKVVSGAVLGVTEGISKQVSETIEKKATYEVMKNFNNLGEKEKEVLKNAICK